MYFRHKTKTKFDKRNINKDIFKILTKSKLFFLLIKAEQTGPRTEP